jgi:hypothetical protein
VNRNVVFFSQTRGVKIMPKKKSYRQPTHRPLLTDHEKNWAFCVAIRDESVFSEAKLLVKDEHFSESESALALVWRVVAQFHAEAGKLPSSKIIITRCNAELKLNPSCLAPGAEKDVNTILGIAFGMEEEDLHPQVALDTIRKFLEDRLVFQSQEILSTPQTPLSLVETFGDMRAQAVMVASRQVQGRSLLWRTVAYALLRSA